ncbi:MAG: toprim domain-containing protein, partial [bacterium]
TALTEYHLSQINRLTTKVIMAFDGDLAGIKAARRGVDLALRAGMEVDIAELPLDVDPADLIKDKPEAWRQTIDGSKHIIDFLLSTLTKSIVDGRELKLAISRDVLPYVASLANNLEQAHFVSKIASVISVGEEPIWGEVRRARAGQSEATPIESVVNNQQPQVLSRQQTIEKQIFSIILWQESLGTLLPEIKTLIDSIKEFLTEIKYNELIALWRGEGEPLILEAEIYFDNKSLPRELEELINNYKIEIWKDDLEKISVGIKQAEIKEDHEVVDELVRKMQEITKQINNIKK